MVIIVHIVHSVCGMNWRSVSTLSHLNWLMCWTCTPGMWFLYDVHVISYDPISINQRFTGHLMFAISRACFISLHHLGVCTTINS